MKTRVCSHDKRQTGIPQSCQRCRFEENFLNALERDLAREIDQARLAEMYDLKEKP